MNHDKDLRLQVSNAFRKFALNLKAKDYLLNQPEVFQLLKPAAIRYSGGENLENLLQAVNSVNLKGISATVDFMGESTFTAHQATVVTEEFLNLIEKLPNHVIDNSISLDLSHIGLTVNKDLCIHNFQQIVSRTSAKNMEVMISAENLERVDDVLHIYKKTSTPLVGVTLQAYLHRTQKDFLEVIDYPGKIRIVKGAFDVAASEILPRSNELNSVYRNYIEMLLQRNHKCSIATHDPILIEEILNIIQEKKFKSSLYEFEFLYGVQNDLLERLSVDGYPCRKYVVYGKEWYLYLCNRIAENPENLFQAIVDISNNH